MNLFSRVYRMCTGNIVFFLRKVRQLDIKFIEMIQFLLCQVFNINHPVACALVRGYQLIQLKVYGLAVLILRFLDQENHQERNNGSAGVYHQLPSV